MENPKNKNQGTRESLRIPGHKLTNSRLFYFVFSDFTYIPCSFILSHTHTQLNLCRVIIKYNIKDKYCHAP